MAFYIPYIRLNCTWLDIGCGAGRQLTTVLKDIKKYICADIVDNRRDQTGEFVKLELNQPCNLPDASIDIISMFHVAHHANDLLTRVSDIVRMLVPGGMLFLKDHDVTDAIVESNVTFEHIVYEVTEGADIDDLIKSNGGDLTYYSLKDYINMFTAAGLTHVDSRLRKSFTNIFDAVFVKKI
jgi:ubiquinone/menaquinone biosynthesis C-methylase UbiE